MRLFFLVLLLANLALWYWHEPVSAWLHWDPPERSLRPAASAPEVPKLMLLSELQQGEEARAEVTGPVAPQADADAAAPVEPPVGATTEPAPQPPMAEIAPPPPVATVTAPPVPGAVAGSCVEVGPWSEQAAAEAALASIGKDGLSGEVVAVERERLAGYWMLTADRYDRAGVREVLRRMQEQGVTDIAIVSLDTGWAISLGLFSRKSALERRRAQMLELGYTPEVRERTETRTEYLLRLASTDGAARNAAEHLAGKGPGLEWQTVECPPAQD